MILYTPLSETDIFPASEKEFTNRHCVSYQGKQLFVEEMEDGQYQLLQLLSTDPHDFMAGEFIPGTIFR